MDNDHIHVGRNSGTYAKANLKRKHRFGEYIHCGYINLIFKKHIKLTIYCL